MKYFTRSLRYLAASLPVIGGCSPSATFPRVDPCRMDQLSIAAAFTNRLGQKGARPIQILVLSGGGSYGAWGAGVLRGWRNHPTAPRPLDFDVVTAVSTGALQASHAFVGGSGDDDALQRAFTAFSSDNLYRARWWALIPFSNSLCDTGGLAQKIRQTITDDLIDRVAEQGRLGRRLYVATTNLDRSTLTIWDMTCIAGSTDAGRYDRYRTILLAATAIPVLFPPVRIDGELHADGGTRADLFLTHALLPIVRQGKQIRAKMKLAPVNPTVYILINGKLSVTSKPTPNYLLPIAVRALSNLLDVSLQNDIAAISVLAREEAFDTRLSYVPADNVADFSADVFDARQMSALYQSGVDWGATHDWLIFNP